MVALTPGVGGGARTSCYARITTRRLSNKQMVDGWSPAKTVSEITMPCRLA